MSRYPEMRGPVEDGQVLKVVPGATEFVDSQECTNNYNLLQNVTRYVIPEACAKHRVFNCIFKTRRVPRCLQHLQNASHVRHGNTTTRREKFICSRLKKRRKPRVKLVTLKLC